MHKLLFNHMTIYFVIRPYGPILIKSGREAGADPTLPDMNFVRTQHPLTGAMTIYLPGSSLKGVVRSRAEQIARTLGVRCCDPIGQDACGGRKNFKRLNKLNGAETYQELCTICRIFGHTVMASRLNISDAYPPEPVNDLSVRQMVAIDRRSGGSANPFDVEVSTSDEFIGELSLKNFERWQVGLIALVLRDINLGTVRIGFGKSRGLGRVTLEMTSLVVRYPGILSPESMGNRLYWLQGVEDLAPALAEEYGFCQTEFSQEPDFGPENIDTSTYGQVALWVEGHEAIEAILSRQVGSWSQYVSYRQEDKSA